MLKMIIFTLAGLALFAGSVTSGYVYVQAASQTQQLAWIFAALSGVCLILAGIAFVFAARAHDPYAFDDKETTVAQNDPQIATIGLQSAVQKQNEIVSQWRKTNHMKDKMTMIKISSNAQKQPTAP